ncbi:MAG: DoxX family protein [Tepidisphaeraceae bacterium]
MTATLEQPMTAPARAGAMVWTGRVISTLVTLFMLMDAGMKVARAKVVVEKTAEMGIPIDSITAIGWVLLVSTILYAIPRTAALGAVLLTGYLGGAIAVNVLMVKENAAFGVVFASVVGVLAWLGLYFRDARVRRVLPVAVG